MPLMIKCTTCGKTKELHKYYECKDKKNGRQSRCKACMIKASLARREDEKGAVLFPSPSNQLSRSFDRAVKSNAYVARRAVSAALLMFIEATPEERAKKMRIAENCYK